MMGKLVAQGGQCSISGVRLAICPTSLLQHDF